MATKDDIANMATKDDIANMATKDDLTILESHILHAIQQLLTPGAAFSQPVVDLQILPSQTDREM
jgi:hypothetical protein